MARAKKIKLEKTPKIMGLNNEPISPEIKKEDVNIPEPFQPVTNVIQNKKGILTYNNRVYIRLGNGVIKFADNGQVMLESELR